MRIKVEKRPVVVPGFRFAGVACGIKPSGKKDLGLIVSEVPATAVAAFTTNKSTAAPVLVGRERSKTGRLQAVVVNSGIANVATGQVGVRLARDTCTLVGRTLGIDEQLVLPSSTGKIGVLPPWDRMQAGILAACAALSPRGFWNALAGIMTTDAFPKAAIRQVSVGGKSVTIAGMAKGAGMINPTMATMLCYVLTDARVELTALRRVLDHTLTDSFNAISVDGDTSTSDTVVLLANGRAGNQEVRAAGADFHTFKTAVGEVLRELSRLVVKDGEGATRVVDIFVQGAKNSAEAEKIARTVAYSPLVKTAFFGGDPNWGRIVGAIGNSGVRLDSDRVDIYIGGVPISDTTLEQAREKLKAREIQIRVVLHSGSGSARIWTCDLTDEYIRINADYTT